MRACVAQQLHEYNVYFWYLFHKPQAQPYFVTHSTFTQLVFSPSRPRAPHARGVSHRNFHL